MAAARPAPRQGEKARSRRNKVFVDNLERPEFNCNERNLLQKSLHIIIGRSSVHSIDRLGCPAAANSNRVRQRLEETLKRGNDHEQD
jgi:hypothetical protein